MKFQFAKRKNGERKAVRSRGWGAWLANTHYYISLQTALTAMQCTASEYSLKSLLINIDISVLTQCV